MLSSFFRQAWDSFRPVNLGALLNAGSGGLEALLRRVRPWSFPWKLDLILTKACNLRCRFCISYESLKGERWMDFGLYEQIAHTLFPWTHSLFFCSGGEPLLYPRFREVLSLAGRYRTHTTLVTNGMLLTPQTADWLVETQYLQKLTVSFDGARKETLEAIRRGADYDLILGNIAYLNDVKQRRRAPYPRLSLHYVVMASNARELPGIFPLSARIGISRVRVSYLNVCNDLEDSESLFYQPRVAEAVFRESRGAARKYGIALDLPVLPGQRVWGRRCLQPWEFCQIDTDGSIRHCYYSWRQRLGFFQDGFSQVWRGEHYQRLRQTLDGPAAWFPYCAHCPGRHGIDWESSHFQNHHNEAYVIPGLEHLQVPFKPR